MNEDCQDARQASSRQQSAVNRMERIVDLFNSFACNVAVAYDEKNWEAIEEAFLLMQDDRDRENFPTYKGCPTIPNPFQPDSMKNEHLGPNAKQKAQMIEEELIHRHEFDSL